MELLILESFADRCAKITGQTRFFHTLLQYKVPAKIIVEKLTGRTNTLVYDDAGLPSLMVRIPCFCLEQVIPHAGNAVHPMFQTSRGQVQYVWLSKYQNITKKCAYSLPDQGPRNFISYDEALEGSRAKAPGGQSHRLSLRLDPG